MTKKFSIFILLFLPIAALALTACLKKPEPTVNPDPVSTNDQKPPEENNNTYGDRAKEVESYYNNELGFSFKYPRVCIVKTSSELPGFDQGKKLSINVLCGESIMFSMSFLSEDFSAGVEEGCCFDYAGQPIDTKLSLEELSQELKKLKPRNVEKTSVADKAAIKFFSEKRYAANWVVEEYIIPFYGDKYSNIMISSPTLVENGKQDVFDLSNINLENNEEYKEFHRILESIIF